MDGVPVLQLRARPLSAQDIMKLLVVLTLTASAIAASLREDVLRNITLVTRDNGRTHIGYRAMK